MVRVVWMVVALAVGAAMGAEDRIARIRTQVADRTARIPNYTCLETIERLWYADDYATGKTIDRLRLEVAAIEGKEEFAWPGGSRFDSQDIQEILGRGVSKTGDFSGFLDHIFTSNAATYTLFGEEPAAIRPSIRYDYRVPASDGYLLFHGGARAVIGYHGSFWVDPETLDLLRVEIEGDEIPAALRTASAKLAIDYGPVAVGAGTFLLPQATDVRLIDNHGLASRTITRFSRCRQFLAESTISFDERPSEQAAAAADPGAELPEGLTLEAELTTPIERKSAAIGDLVEALLRKEVKAKGGIVVPKGAVVEGRIVRLETRGSDPPCDLLLLRFTKLRFGARQVRLRASVARYGTGYSVPRGSPRSVERARLRLDPHTPIQFWGGFVELPKGLALSLATEAVPAR